MIKIIETNFSVGRENTIKDHQSRVIEVNGWGEYIAEIMDGKTVERKDIIGNLHGNTIPKNASVHNLIYDDFHLSYDIHNKFGIWGKKFAYKVRGGE